MRAQVTIYIIIGITLLFFLGLGTYVFQKNIPPPVTQPFPALTTYVTDCLYTVAQEAVTKLGRQGGHLHPTDARHTFTISTNPSEGDALVLSPPKEQPITYWWYMKTPNTCTQCILSTQHVPTLEHMAQEVEQEIKQTLPACINNFAPFAIQGAHVAQEEIQPRIQFTKQDIQVTLTWPLHLTSGTTQQTLKEFETTLSIPLKNMYETALTIVQQEKENATLENNILHMLGLYSGISATKLPPPSALTHTANTITWNKNSVEQNLYALFATTIQLMHFGNNPPTEPELKPLHTQTNTPFKIQFQYLGWPFFFNISPENTGLLTPSTTRTHAPQNLLPTFQTNTYEFFYDISLPILTEIQDPASAYSFFFALEANIRDNKPLHSFHQGEGTIGPWDPTRVSSESTVLTTAIEACTKQPDNTYQCPITSTTFQTFDLCQPACTQQTEHKQTLTINKTLFCDTEQRISGTLKITVHDAQNKTPIPDARVRYNCGTFDTCSLPSTNTRGVVKTKLPLCTNGRLTIEKQNYHPTTQTYTAQYEKQDTLALTLQQLKTIFITIKKYHTNGTEITLGPRSLSPGEQVILTLDRKEEKPFEQHFSTYLNIDSPDPVTASLIPGTYEVNAQFIDNKGFTIPKGCMNICEAYNKEGRCTAYKGLPERTQHIEPALLGGIVLNNNTGYFTITPYDLYTSTQNTLQFSVIRPPTPTCIAKEQCVLETCIGLDELGKTEEYTKKFRKELKPYFLEFSRFAPSHEKIILKPLYELS